MLPTYHYEFDIPALKHMFLTVVTWTPNGPWRESKGSAKNTTVMGIVPIHAFLQGVRSPLIAFIDTIRVNGFFLETFWGPRSKKG